MPIHTTEEATRIALDILPESGGMLFSEWIDKCVAAGVEREMLRSWPNWKARGLVATKLEQAANGVQHFIMRGEAA